jgi:hypothetical protein
LLIERVADELDFEADDVLVDAKPVERTPNDFELVTGERELEPIQRSSGNTVRRELKVVQVNGGEVSVRAPAIARAIAGNEGKRDEACAAGAVDIIESGGEVELTLIGTDEACVCECRARDAERYGGGQGEWDESARSGSHVCFLL